MANLKGTKTEANLQAAFAGESMARNKYTYFASKAKKDGYVQIAAIFEETAANEKEHAKMWFKLLNDGIGSTVENLKAAATNVERFVDIANKYTDLRELTHEVLRTFIERIIIHKRTAKHSKTATLNIANTFFISNSPFSSGETDVRPCI